MLDEIFAARDLAEWATILAGLSTPWSIVQSAAEAAVDPQTAANHYLAEVQGAGRSFPLVASPAQFDNAPTTLTRAPDHGEHTEEILLELGRDWVDIAHLKEIGAVL